MLWKHVAVPVAQSEAAAETAPVVSPLDWVRSRLNFHPDEHQAKIFSPAIKNGLLCCTRRFGKSTTVAALAVHHAMTHPNAEVLVVAPYKEQSGEFLHKVENFLKKLGIRRKRDGIHRHSLVLPNGSRIFTLADNEATVRSYDATLIIIDEAARVSDAAIKAILPSLATTDGSIWMMSTPNGRMGAFYREWIGSGPWFRLRVNADQVSRIPAAFLEEQRRTLGERDFAQEYCNEFHSPKNAVFDDELVDSCLTGELYHPPIPGMRFIDYVIGVDFGKINDYTTLTVLERLQDPAGLRFTIRRLERFPLHTKYKDIRARVKAVTEEYPVKGNCRLILDGTGLGEPVDEFFRDDDFSCPIEKLVITGGEKATQGHVPKKDLMTNLTILMESNQLHIPKDLPGVPWLMEEFRAMRAYPTHSGETRYESPAGEHDDLVMSLALAAWRVRPRVPTVGERGHRIL